MYKVTQSTFQHFTTYISDNLSCLLYILDLVTQQCNWLTSYTNFLLDISEIFGAWLSVSVLLLSAITVLSYIHSVSSFVWDKSKSKFVNTQTNLVSYRNIKNIIKNKNNFLN